MTSQQRAELRGILANLERAEEMAKNGNAQTAMATGYVTQASDALARYLVKYGTPR